MRIEVDSVNETRPFIVEFDIESVSLSQSGDVTIEGSDSKRRRSVYVEMDRSEWEELLEEVDGQW